MLADKNFIRELKVTSSCSSVPKILFSGFPQNRSVSKVLTGRLACWIRQPDPAACRKRSLPRLETQLRDCIASGSGGDTWAVITWQSLFYVVIVLTLLQCERLVMCKRSVSSYAYVNATTFKIFFYLGGELKRSIKSHIRTHLVSEFVDRLIFRTEHDVSDIG